MLTLGDFLTVAEAAEYLGVCPNTIRNWGKDEKIPEHRHPLNNYRLYKRSDLDGVLRQIARPAKRKRTHKAK
ncbi:MAG: helix-turn-helix domain-containing protein [Pirellulaceae bacterium]|nr:helix-turn-helix domain-containing protein [Pirellulaceae bacterium]